MDLNNYPELKAGGPCIKEITSAESIESSAEIVRASFRTVAQEFGLTEENNPTHPSFITAAHLSVMKDNGWQFFGLFKDSDQVGFEAVKLLENGACGLEKLAVAPSCRHLGYGRALVYFALDLAGRQNASRLELTLIDENKVLKNWYLELGFREVELKKFPHLPFTVCFMQYDLEYSSRYSPQIPEE